MTGKITRQKPSTTHLQDATERHHAVEEFKQIGFAGMCNHPAPRGT